MAQPVRGREELFRVVVRARNKDRPFRRLGSAGGWVIFAEGKV